jgi:hypothetical protein
MKVGESGLLRAVREEDKDTIILTNGFSCREQIAQGTERKAVHLAELMHAAITGDALNEKSPEEYYRHNYVEETIEGNLIPSILISAGAVLVIGLAALWNRNR